MLPFPVIPEKPANETCIVVLSGGQDSTTCLGLALKCFDKVYAIGFNYGQQHSIELMQAQTICNELAVPFTIADIPALKDFDDSALVKQNGDVSKPHHRNDKLPASFVPCRNALMLTIAHAFAQKKQATTIMTGVCQTDYSGYPDCREEFIVALEHALNTGYLTDIKIATPLMNLTKAQTFKLARDVKILHLVLEHSHTCYKGDRFTVNTWGRGCGKCPACELRAKGFKEYEEIYG